MPQSAALHSDRAPRFLALPADVVIVVAPVVSPFPVLVEEQASPRVGWRSGLLVGGDGVRTAGVEDFLPAGVFDGVDAVAVTWPW